MLNSEIIIVETLETLTKLFSYATKVKSDIVSFDLETDSVIPSTTNLYGIGVCFDTFRGFYIPWRRPPEEGEAIGELVWDEDTRTEISQWILELAETKKMIGHNIIFDVLVTKQALGIDITKKFYSDTILLKHSINEERPHGLKECAVQELGDWADKAQTDLKEEVIAKGGSWTLKNKEMYKASTHTLGKYCVWDVLLTLLLFQKYSTKLTEEGLDTLFYEDETIPLYKECTIPMKEKGFNINVGHFQSINKEVRNVLDNLEAEIVRDITADCADLIDSIITKKVPLKPSRLFIEHLAAEAGIPLPITKDNKLTLAAKAIAAQKDAAPEFSPFYDWVLGGLKFEYASMHFLSEDINIPVSKIKDARHKLYCKQEKCKFIFNIRSNHHLIDYYITKKGNKNEVKGKIKVDAKFFTELAKTDKTAAKLLEYKKLKKIHSTYILGILARHINGVIYTDMLQFGTTSGRYSSVNPNLNNLPAIKEDVVLTELVLRATNSIRAGFVARPGYKMIGCDWSSLEPHLAAYVSGDEGLLDIFVSGKDFYSAIAIKQFGITDATPFNDDTPESFPKKYKSLRNTTKGYALSAFYGATAPKIAQLTGKSPNEAQALLDGYFKAFPKVKELITKTHKEAVTKGFVKTKLGRVRHLTEALELHKKYSSKNLLNYKWAKSKNLLAERGVLINLLNNAVNFKIQGFAAHCLNRAMIKMARELKRRQLDARILLCIHDEVLVEAAENVVQEVAEVVKWAMETCVDVSPIKLKAKPIIGDNYAECK